MGDSYHSEEICLGFSFSRERFNQYPRYSWHGLAHTQKGKLDEAIADFDQSIRLRPDRAHIHDNRAMAFAQRGDFDQAIAEYGEALRLKTDYPAAVHLRRGQCYFELGQYEPALTDCEQSLALAPKSVWAFHLRGLIFKAVGREQEAISDFRQIIALDLDEQLSQTAAEELKELEAARSSEAEASLDDRDRTRCLARIEMSQVSAELPSRSVTRHLHACCR